MNPETSREQQLSTNTYGELLGALCLFLPRDLSPRNEQEAETT